MHLFRTIQRFTPDPKIMIGGLFVLFGAPAIAQLDVPGPLEMNGAQPNDRQVNGLALPLSLDAAASVDAVRTNSTAFAEVAGTSQLTGALVPPPNAYAAGMVITILPTSANHAGATLDLNNLGARPIVKAGGIPIDSADLWPNVPSRLIYDGQRFIVLGSTSIPCKTGFSVGAREYCIEDSSRAALSFFDAMAYCKGRGARLCKNSEWVYQCLKVPGFIGTVLNYEWVDDAANNQDGTKKVGNGGNGETGTIPGIDCKHGFWAVPTSVSRFRCCMTR